MALLTEEHSRAAAPCQKACGIDFAVLKSGHGEHSGPKILPFSGAPAGRAEAASRQLNVNERYPEYCTDVFRLMHHRNCRSLERLNPKHFAL